MSKSSPTRLGSLAAAATTMAAVAATLLGAPAAGAASTHPVIYLGVAAGTSVKAADGTVTSGPTAASTLQGVAVPASAHSNLAGATVGALISTGAIATNQDVAAFAGGAKLTSHAKTLGVNLLRGLVSADVVDTTSTASFNGTSVDGVASTTFANLQIRDINVPVQIPRNYTVNIPGVARIVLDYSSTYRYNGALANIGAGIYIRLLADRGTAPLGTQIYLNPTYAAITAHIPNTPVLVGGTTYGSKVNVAAGDVVNADLGRSALQLLPNGGTHGAFFTNSTASVHIAHVLTTGAVETRVRGVVTKRTGTAQTKADVAGLNLFDGAIKADAVSSSAAVQLRLDGTTVITNRSRFVGLQIGRQHYPVTVEPNTRINVAGLGTVTLNYQSHNDFYTNVRAISVRLSTARAGLSAGAVVEVAYASAYLIS